MHQYCKQPSMFQPPPTCLSAFNHEISNVKKLLNYFQSHPQKKYHISNAYETTQQLVADLHGT